MPELSLIQRIQIAGGIARVLANHPGDIAALVTDARKAMGIAAEIHGVIDGVTAQSAPKPPAAAAPIPPAETPDAPWHSRAADQLVANHTSQRNSAVRALHHVEQNGLSAAEQAIFDRASGASTG